LSLGGKEVKVGEKVRKGILLDELSLRILDLLIREGRALSTREILEKLGLSVPSKEVSDSDWKRVVRRLKALEEGGYVRSEKVGRVYLWSATEDAKSAFRDVLRSVLSSLLPQLPRIEVGEEVHHRPVLAFYALTADFFRGYHMNLLTQLSGEKYLKCLCEFFARFHLWFEVRDFPVRYFTRAIVWGPLCGGRKSVPVSVGCVRFIPGFSVISLEVLDVVLDFLRQGFDYVYIIHLVTEGTLGRLESISSEVQTLRNFISLLVIHGIGYQLYVISDDGNLYPVNVRDLLLSKGVERVVLRDIRSFNELRECWIQATWNKYLIDGSREVLGNRKRLLSELGVEVY